MATEADSNASAFFSESDQQLNSDQNVTFNINKTKIGNKAGGLIFINAPGGTGKTFLFNVILAYVL